MSLDPRTPVLVGVGAVSQREEDPDVAREPIELMRMALERAAKDAGSPALLGRADAILVPRGFWDYVNPGRWLAESLGAGTVHSEVAEIGVLQTSLIGRAAQTLAEGQADVVLVAGGEARHRQQRAAKLGREASLTQQAAEPGPDRVLRPSGVLLSEHELRAGLAMPVGYYAMIENALRAHEGQELAAHQRDVAALWAGFSQVAAQNPDAWSREIVTADSIRETRDGNRMLAFPYTKRHNSQWNVDQAAGLIFCSVARAQQLGIPRARWVFPLAVADSNHMLPLSERPALQRSPGFARAGERARARGGCEVDELTQLELYSCFPVAVRVQQRELGLPREATPSVTGGMAFAGGPLNNFVLQAQVRMAERLRAEPGSVGLVTAVSGMLTKQGVSLWSTEPRAQGFAFDDVSDEAAAETGTREVVARGEGDARIASYTVFDPGASGERSVLLCDLEDGKRCLAVSTDPELARVLQAEEGCGRALRLAADGSVELR